MAAVVNALDVFGNCQLEENCFLRPHGNIRDTTDDTNTVHAHGFMAIYLNSPNDDSA